MDEFPLDEFPLVGRARELSQLQTRLAAAAGGSGRTVLIAGEAGIGKTTLVQTASRGATSAGATILSGGCYDLTETPPYGPWRELAAHAAAVPRLAPLPALLAERNDIASRGDQQTLFAGVRDWLLAAAGDRPLVLVLEDLHWADVASLDLLRYVARQSPLGPLLLIVTYRADELSRQHPLSPLLPLLVREAGADRLDLRRLDDEAVRDLVEARWPLPAPERDRLVAYLRLHSGGNPLYARELLRTLEEERVLRPTDEGWTLGALDAIGVPPLLRQVIDSRVDRLGEETRELLAAAAILGDEVPVSLWATVAGRSEDEVLLTSERASAARLLAPSRDGTRVTFSHTLIRETLYDGTPPPRRRLWDRRAGEALAVSSRADPDTVAHHYRRAGDPRAWEWLVRAGERAQRSYAWTTAAERFLAAQALLEGDDERAAERGWLLYRAGRLLRFTDPQAGIRLLDEAVGVARDADEPVLGAYARADRGNLLCLVGEISIGLRELQAGVGAIDALPADHAAGGSPYAAWTADALPSDRDGALGSSPVDDDLAAVNPRRGTLTIWLASVGRFTEARTMGEPLVARIDAAAAPVPLPLAFAGGDIAYALGLAAAANGEVAAARRAFARSREPARSTGHHVSVGWMAERELSHVILPFQPDHLPERRRVAAEAEAAMTRAGGDTGPSAMPPRRGALRLLILEGEWNEAWQVSRAARGIGTHYGRQETAAALARLAAARGEGELAWQQIDEVLPGGPETVPGGTIFHVAVEVQRVAVDLALAAGDLAVAEAWLRAHDDWLEWSGSVRGRADGLVRWAAVAHASGDHDRAKQQAETALAAAAAPRQPLAAIAAHRLLGRIEIARAAYEAAAASLDEALALAGACAAPYEEAETRLALAELHAARGDATEAAALLADVRLTGERLGAAPLLARAALPSGAEGPRPPGRQAAALSQREIEVLRLVAEGLTNQEVAGRLSISPRTVGQHLRSIYTKHNLSSRAAATRFAITRGLLD